MTLLGWICCGLGTIIIIVLTVRALQASARAAGFKDGYANGYAKGRKDADNWWIGVEEEADEQQRQLWREEVHRGRIRHGRNAA